MIQIVAVIMYGLQSLEIQMENFYISLFIQEDLLATMINNG